jgi:hypothetical protein
MCLPDKGYTMSDANSRSCGRVERGSVSSNGDPGRPDRPPDGFDAGDGTDGAGGFAGAVSAITGTVLPLNAHTGDSGAVYFLGFGFLVGLAAIYHGAKRWRVGQLLRNTATERIRSVAAGRTEVDGVCRDAGLTHEQPYADGECVYRHWRVEEYERTGGENDDREWQTVDAGTDVAPFFVEDDTGRILVDTTQAPYFEISEENSYSTTVVAGDEPPEEVRSFSPYDDSPAERLEGTAVGRMMETALGADTMERMLEGAADEGVEAGADADAARERALEQHVDDTAEFGPSDLLGGMATGDGADGDDGAEPTDDEQRAEAIVRELGGTGEAGDMGTGASLARRLIDAALDAATGGRLGSSWGGGGRLFGTQGSPDSSNRRRYSHEVLPVDEDVYVFGGTEPRPEATGSNEDRLALGVDSGTGQFIVSDRDESGIVEQYTRRGPLYTLAGVVVSTACLYGLLWAFGVA